LREINACARKWFLVPSCGPWQGAVVRRLLDSCFVALGLLAVALALVAVPTGIVLVGVKATAAVAAGSDSGDSPCDHPCPGCPKQCPDTTTSCLLKCFQPLARLPEPVLISFSRLASAVSISPARHFAGATIPPLLRPPRA
jgi:hypothetical protein